MTVEELTSRSILCLGASGAGKSFAVLSILIQLLLRGITLVVLDLKGELSQLLQQVVLPAIAGQDPTGKFISNIRIIRPFGSTYLPLLRVTEPEPGVSPEAQAHGIALLLEDALGEELRTRMARMNLMMSTLAVELREPLTVLHRWLEQPSSLARDARRSSNPRVRAYVQHNFEQEARISREALLARLDTFFMLPETRLMFSAPGCVSFKECLESGITIIDPSEPPAGAESVSKFFNGMFVGALTRAILTREIGPQSQPTVVVYEEFQDGLSSGQATSFKRCLSLSRAKKIANVFITQQFSLISNVDPTLPKVLRTNTALEFLFRSNIEDARALAPVLTGGNAKVKTQDAIRQLVSLRDREFLLWAKREAFGPQLMRSADVDLKTLKIAAEQLSDESRQRIEQGTVALPRAELAAVVNKKEGTQEVASASRPKASRIKDKFPELG